eukprot:3231517-Rhodomonas_salina.1
MRAADTCVEEARRHVVRCCRVPRTEDQRDCEATLGSLAKRGLEEQSAVRRDSVGEDGGVCWRLTSRGVGLWRIGGWFESSATCVVVWLSSVRHHACSEVWSSAACGFSTRGLQVQVDHSVSAGGPSLRLARNQQLPHQPRSPSISDGPGTSTALTQPISLNLNHR